MTPESIRIQKLAYQCGIGEWEIGYQEFTSELQSRRLDRLVKLAILVRDAERHRIYAALEADPGALWRDQGFQEWRASRVQD